LGLLHAAPGDVVLIPAQIDRSARAPARAASLEAPHLGKRCLHANDIEALLPLTLRSGGLVAHRLELRLQVQHRELVTPRGHGAPFELSGGEKTDRRLERT